jgi:MFS family permease
VALWVLRFPLVGTSSGASGVLPGYVSDHDPIEIRAAALGLNYNVGALGGAAAPVLGAKLARPLGLGTAIAVLALGRPGRPAHRLRRATARPEPGRRPPRRRRRAERRRRPAAPPFPPRPHE